MISDVKILNGELELKFNEYTYEYTVKVDNNIDHLEFDYKLENDVYVNIRNNYINEDNKIVYLDVYNVDNEITYTFNVYKENSNLSLGIESYKKNLEVVKTDEYYNYKVEGLVIICFFIIVIVFSILFKDKKKI